MAREIIPLGFPARVSYTDADDEERNGTAFAFESGTRRAGPCAPGWSPRGRSSTRPRRACPRTA